MKQLLKDIGINPDYFTLYNLIVSLGIFLLPIAYNVIGIIALIILDFTTGILAARKNKVPVTSNKMSRTAYKLLVYVLLLITALIADKLVGIGMFVKFCTLFLTSTEILSVGENFQKITGISFVKYLKDYIETKVKGKSS